MTRLLFSIILLVGMHFSAEIFAQSTITPTDINKNQLKPALLYWDYGDPAYMTMETIYKSKDSAGDYWNVIHRSMHPTADSDGFDYYRIDAQNMKPVYSQMFYNGQINYSIDFDSTKATVSIINAHDTVKYQVQTPAYIAPEGPGSAAFFACLPLQDNYIAKYYELNRWSAAAPNTGELILTTLRVTGTDTIVIDNKHYPTYVLEITTERGRYTKAWVLKNKPHYWVKTQHKIDAQRSIKAQVIKLVVFDQ